MARFSISARSRFKTGAERFDFPVQTENAGLDSYKASFKADNPALDAYLEDDSLQGWWGSARSEKSWC